MNKLFYALILNLFAIQLVSQCFPDSIVYFNKDAFIDIHHSELYFEIRGKLNSKNFKECTELSDTLFSKYPDTKWGRHYSSICYDQTNQVEKAMKLISENYTSGTCVFQRPRQKEFEWSKAIRNHPEFMKLCSDYDGHYHAPPATEPELRDSLIEILIWTMDSPERNNFHYLNAEKYFSTKPEIDSKGFGQFLEDKFDRLVDEYGFPTAEKVGERMCLVVAMSIIIHSPNVEFMMKYESDVGRVFAHSTHALLQDKISVSQGVPQKYGTQLFYSDNQKQRVFYPIESPDIIDELRMKMGLDPLEKYANMNGVKLETKHNEEYNK